MATETTPAAHLVIITVANGCDDFGHDTEQVISMVELPFADAASAWAGAEDATLDLDSAASERANLSHYVAGVTAPNGTWTEAPAGTRTQILASHSMAA